MSPRPRKEQRHPDLRSAIKDAAWQQIAFYGAPALSLRAIAREVSITAPSIYNYFPNRDALVTALIIDAYADFGSSQLSALREAAQDDFKGQITAVGKAYRQWALNHPERYHLIFGAPIPGYVAPLEEVMPVAARSLTALVSVLDALRVQNRLRLRHEFNILAEHLAMFETWKKLGTEADILSFSTAILIWARVHGLVALEISNNLPLFGPSPDDLYQYELESISSEYIG